MSFHNLASMLTPLSYKVACTVQRLQKKNVFIKTNALKY